MEMNFGAEAGMVERIVPQDENNSDPKHEKNTKGIVGSDKAALGLSAPPNDVGGR